MALFSGIPSDIALHAIAGKIVFTGYSVSILLGLNKVGFKMKVTNTRKLSAYMKDVRETKKLSQSKVASKVGIRQDTVSSFELSPDSTKLETFFKILSALNLELDIKPRNESGSSNSDSGWKEEW